MPESIAPTQAAIDELAPTGVLRAGINLSNFLLVTDKTDPATPKGVAPDMAAALAARLGVAVQYVPFPNPGALADAAGTDTWDVGLIGAEPARAEKIAFTEAYVEIQATYLVPTGSKLRHIADVDAKGVRISVSGRSAYDLWLTRNIENATLMPVDGIQESFDQFVQLELEALAGLRPRLIDDVKKLPGARILDGQFTAVQQAIGTAKTNPNGAAFLADFVEEAKASGMVEGLIEKHGVVGRLTVAGI